MVWWEWEVLLGVQGKCTRSSVVKWWYPDRELLGAGVYLDLLRGEMMEEE